MKKIALFFFVLFFFCTLQKSYADQTLLSTEVDQAPLLDGLSRDLQWNQAAAITSFDQVAGVDITLKAVHTQTTLFLLVSFADPNESRLHKPWIWNKTKQFYQMGPQREDTLVLKWPFDSGVSDFSLTSDTPYGADIWFWKANRTDPGGFADDKVQWLSDTPRPKAMKLQSKSKWVMYLQRLGDQGRPAYKSVLYLDYVKDILPQFQAQQSSGSRADIAAKGVWQDGRWTIEFARALQTGEDDDIQFVLDREYIFGVSRYEVAGRQPDNNLSQPLYGGGDVSERLTLKFGR